jgi:NAD(P)-dependent dehydrogenase (short-subunit alcohol dehydrogenase family)
MNGRKTAVVTGASRGLGKAIAGRLLSEGYDVHACATSRGTAVLEHIGVRAATVDMGDLDGVARWGGDIADTSEVSLLVHNAGPLKTGTVLEAPIADFEDLLRIQLAGPLALTNALVGSMPKGSTIIFITAALGRKVRPGVAAMSMVNSGIVALTRALAAPLVRRGVRVHAICLAQCRTERIDTFGGLSGTSREAFEAEMVKHQPLGLIDPNEVADLVVRLSAEAHMTGWPIFMDGAAYDGI